jgi:hypothetical protein
MYLRRKGIAVLVGALGLLAACSQLDTVLPSAGTYQVNALVNQFSLDECSVIAAGDTVLPYFSSPVGGDPDLIALVVYLEDSEGKALGNRVRYTVEPVEGSGTEGAGDTAVSSAVPSAMPSDNGTGNPVYGSGDGIRDGDSSVSDSGLGSRLDSPEERVIAVDRFTGKLPPLPLPESFEIGSYTLVFEIRGKQDLLSRMSRPVYYIGDREFSTGEIHYYLPGFYGNGNVVPQGLTVMLETRLRAGRDLDPYIVWYNGNRRIGEGPVTAGAARLLWKTPQKSGFQSIRAELFPFKPWTHQKGKVRELSLPVSSGNEETGPFTAPAEQVLYRYQFSGDLLDARTGRELSPVSPDGTAPSWYPGDQVYGLALGPGEFYEASYAILKLSRDGEGDLRFFVRLLPLNGGTIFTARLGAAVHPVTVTLGAEGEALVLSLEGQDQTSLVSRPLELNGRGPSFVEAEITLKLRGTGVYGRLDVTGLPSTAAARRLSGQTEGDSLEGGQGDLDALGAASSQWRSGDSRPFPFKEWAALPLTEALNGEVHSWLGAEKLSGPSVFGIREDSETVRQAGGAAAGTGVPDQPDDPAPLTAVVDDFGALFYPVKTPGSPSPDRERGPAGPESARIPGESAGPGEDDPESSGSAGQTGSTGRSGIRGPAEDPA